MARKRLALALVLMLLVVLAALPVRAAEFRSGNLVVIEQGRTIDDDLFVSAQHVIVNGTVNGDLWIAGSQAEVNGSVNGSLFFAGQQLDVRGAVRGSLYGVGSQAVLGARADVARNLYFAGFALSIDPRATVGRDAFAAGNQALIAGRVGRNLSFSGSALDITGSIGNDVQANVGAPGSTPSPPRGFAPAQVAPAAPGIRVSERARIGGRLSYRSPVDQSANIRARPARGIVFTPTPRAPRLPAGVAWLLAWLRLYGSLIALGALALYGLGAPLRRLSERAAVVPLLSVGWGILIILAGFAAAFVAAVLIMAVTALLAAITFGGLAATVLFGAGTAWAFGFTIFLLAVIWGSRIIVSYLLGWLVLERLAGLRRVESIYILAVGTGIYSLAQSIPFFGAVASAIATVLGFGAIYLVWQESQAPAGLP